MKNNNMILCDETVDKEYQIPELVDLNSIGEAMGALTCNDGSSATSFCITGFAL